NMWVELGLALLFLYMSSFQLIPLFSHHQTLIWMDLYPVEKADQQASFLKGSKQLGFIQTIIFTAVFLIEVDWIGAILIFVLGMLFIYVFHQFYVQKKIQVKESPFIKSALTYPYKNRTGLLLSGSICLYK